MRTRSLRAGALLATLVLVVAACGPATTNPSTAASSPPGASAPATSQTAPPAGVVEIRWFCCLGGGDAQEQVAEEKRIVEEFNASHPNIHVTFDVTAYAGARDALSTQIASGNGPDIVGPVGIGGAEAFHGQWLDLKPHIDSAGYDMSQFPQSTVDLYNVGGEGQLGIPFAVYPSILYYKADHFAEAGLNEPPHEWGGKYKMPDGTEVAWDYDTAREIGMKLTVDKNGKDATEAGFDPENIVQWGFEPQRDDLRQTGAYWEAGKLAGGPDGTTVEIPDGWQDAWHWFYDGMWTDHFAMTGPTFQSTDFNPSDYPFFTGNVSMSQNYLWASWALADAGDDWNVAATPSNNSKTVAAFNADTFRIMKSTKHPDEAFEVLKYLLDDAAPDLLKAYGGMPAREKDQDAFFEAFGADHPADVDWKVAKEGVKYADVPNFESYMPAYNESLDLIITFGTKWQATPNLNIDTEITDLKSQLQAIWDRS